MKATLFIATLFFVSFVAAKHHKFALDFTGKATPTGLTTQNLVLKAPGQVITTKIDAKFGVESTTKFLIGTKGTC